MTARISLAAVALVSCFGALLAAGENEVKLAEPVLPEILNLQPVKEERPDIDSPALSEIYQLQRARYNVALEELQYRSKLFTLGKMDQGLLLDSFKRLRKAEQGLAGRPRDGEAGVAAEQAWVIKEAEFFKWLEEIVQAKFDADVAPRHELLEVKFYHLDAKERLANSELKDKTSEK